MMDKNEIKELYIKKAEIESKLYSNLKEIKKYLSEIDFDIVELKITDDQNKEISFIV